ncbi:hypothetical protein PIB30_078740 [Stylosanthes scabra]|uniref:Transposase MuDR plant domain-containing protein n=1 Tax=Stylosanthes scabra TaxID=79078 RepID=A0ABU6SRC0_9FABA|nr:hypothetical protein [Stylosanthes scabra]
MPLRTDQNVSMMFSYHCGIASVFAIELCVQMQDVGGSSSSSNHIEPGRGININESARMLANRRASSPSPSFRPYVNRPVQHPPPEGVNNNNGDDEEFIPRKQPPVVESNLDLPTIATPLRRVLEEAADYSTINPEGMQSGSVEDGPSSYPVSGELELEIRLKFSNREIAMLAVKNYNIQRSVEFKVVKSDRARYVCKCKQFGGQCQWMIWVAKTKSSRFWEVLMRVHH